MKGSAIGVPCFETLLVIDKDRFDQQTGLDELNRTAEFWLEMGDTVH